MLIEGQKPRPVVLHNLFIVLVVLRTKVLFQLRKLILSYVSIQGEPDHFLVKSKGVFVKEFFTVLGAPWSAVKDCAIYILPSPFSLLDQVKAEDLATKAAAVGIETGGLPCFLGFGQVGVVYMLDQGLAVLP